MQPTDRHKSRIAHPPSEPLSIAFVNQPSDDPSAPAAPAPSNQGPPPLPNVVPQTSSARASSKKWRLGMRGIVGLSLAGLLVLFKLGSFLNVVGSEGRAPRSEPGISYRNERIRKEPWSIHIIQVDRAQKDLGFYSAHARNRVLGVGTLADQAREIPGEIGQAVAGVNGDFYVRDDPTYGGDPRGIQIIQGELLSGPSTVCVWFDGEGNPHLDEVKGSFQVTWPGGGRLPFKLNEQRLPGQAVLYTPSYGASTKAGGGRELILEKEGSGPWVPLRAGQTYHARIREVRSQGDTGLAKDVMVLSLDGGLLSRVPELKSGMLLELSTATDPDLGQAQAAIAGGPAIIKDGKPFSLRQPPPGTSGNYSERSKYERHPRSAIGWSQTHFYFVTVDGRQQGLSVGMKLAELAEYMSGLGCTEAMNLDGGKSAQMWMRGRIMNDPCQGEDTVANALFVVRKSAAR